MSNPRKRVWCYTLNNPTDREVEHLKTLTLSAVMHVAQKEVGEQKTEHVQGVIEFKHGKTFSAVKKLIPRAHLEPCRGKEASIKYCCKSDGFIEAVARKGAPIQPRVVATLRPWQKAVVRQIDEDIKEEDDRTIHWYWDGDGCSGKTALARWLVVHRQALFLGGKAKDALYAVAQALENGAPPSLIVFNLARTREQFVSYETLESVKDGIFFSGKYESCSVIFNSPAVVVFANFEPDRAKLSQDRWDVVEVNELDEQEQARSEPASDEEEAKGVE